MSALVPAIRPLAMRDAFLEQVWQGMQRDEMIYFVTADFGSPVLDKIRRDFPTRFVNVGIAEQNLINVSCGLALEGFCVFAYAIAPFITMRCFEQIRVNLALLSTVRPMNVNLIGVGAGYSYVMSGPTHQCYEDLTLMRGLPNLHIYSPSDHIGAEGLFARCLAEKRPKYLRFDAQVLPVLEQTGDDPARGYLIRQKGEGLCLIATGYMVHTALAIAGHLAAQNIAATLVDLFDLSDFDRDGLVSLMRRHSHLVSMEEGFRGRGGMDSMLFEIVARHKVAAPMLNLGVEPAYSFEQGTRQQLHERVGIGEQGALAEILGFYKVRPSISGGV
jgi:transketolase